MHRRKFIESLGAGTLLAGAAPVNLKVFVDGTVCVVYVADKIAMSTRLYDLKQGGWGVFVNEGSARFRNVQISV